MSRLIDLSPAAAVTASGNSVSAQIGAPDSEVNPDDSNVNVLLRTTAVTGTTPSLTVEVQWSNDNVNFVSTQTPDAFTAITAVTGVEQTFPMRAPYMRLKFTVSGTTPSFTLSATAYAT